jgi:hypothetical protein
MANALYETNNLHDWLETNDKITYTDMYISIGGKHNEPFLHFNYPETVRSKKQETNSLCQMIPQFVRSEYHTETKYLVIVIDRFVKDDPNIRLIKNIISIPGIANMDVVLYNHECKLKTLPSTIQEICKKAEIDSIEPSKMMICNYICFQTPNEFEFSMEQKTPELIQSVLNGTVFENQFYQWYGYSIFTYNLIYPYKKYNFMRMMNSSYLLSAFVKSFQDMSVSTKNIYLIVIYLDSLVDTRLKKIVAQFMENSYDITYRNKTALNAYYTP